MSDYEDVDLWIRLIIWLDFCVSFKEESVFPAITVIAVAFVGRAFL